MSQYVYISFSCSAGSHAIFTPNVRPIARERIPPMPICPKKAGKGDRFMNPCAQVCICGELGEFAISCEPSNIKCYEEFQEELYVKPPKILLNDNK